MIWVSEHLITHPSDFIPASVLVPLTRTPYLTQVCMREWCAKYDVPFRGATTAGVLQITCAGQET